MTQRIVTKHPLALALMLGMSSLVTAQVADAQPRWGRSSAPRAGACFYRDANFRGEYFCAGSGENVAFMGGGMNNQISSIRTFGDVEVTIFQEPRFQGRWTRLEGDVRNLRRAGWNDRLSSVRVNGGYGPGRGRGDINGNGRRGSGLGRIETGEWRDDRGGLGGSDRGYNRDDPRGDYRTDPRDPRGDNRGDFRTDPRTDDRNDSRDTRGGARGSGVQTTPAPVVLTPEQSAVALVARAYRAVLGREPDPASRVYVDKVLRERWTEADVSKALRDSPEYRNKR